MAFATPILSPVHRVPRTQSHALCSTTACPRPLFSSSTSTFLQPSSFTPRFPLSSPVVCPGVVSRTPVVAVASVPGPPPKILIAGAPASGKGTQCQFLVSHFGVVHISTGDMLRAAVNDATSLGLEAKSYMDAGQLVPDDLVISLLKDRIMNDDCRRQGWLLDGFPRTAVQARALDDAGIIPTSVLLLQVADDVLIERVVGRRLDPQTGDIYHLKFNPPTDPDILQRLTKRSDDTEEKARVRLQTFYTHSQSIIDHYSDLVRAVDGDRPKQLVFNDLVEIIEHSSDHLHNDDDHSSPSAPTVSDPVVRPQTDGDGSTSASAKGLSVSEFVQRAEEAFERGSLLNEEVTWSGQATADTPDMLGSSSYSDLLKRLDLVLGDFIALLTFAYIGRANHGDAALDLQLFKTAAPFLATWFLVTPLLGAYTRSATANVKDAAITFARAWAIAVPMGLALRGVLTERVPPTIFAVISLASTFVIVGSWRIGYVKVRGDETDAGLRGGLFDGFRMMTTLFRRW